MFGRFQVSGSSYEVYCLQLTQECLEGFTYVTLATLYIIVCTDSGMFRGMFERVQACDTCYLVYCLQLTQECSEGLKYAALESCGIVGLWLYLVQECFQ